MSVFDSLLREHVLFERLIRRLENTLRYQREVGRAEARDVLVVLLPALEKHEDLEKLVFGDDAEDELELQHRRLDGLRIEIAELAANAGDRESVLFDRLLPRLVSMLKGHFESEERVLWPRFKARGRTIGRRLERAAKAQVGALERQIAWSWRELADISHS